MATFGTFIADAYSKNEAKEIADSLEEICSPTDLYGWSSSGVYSFWDYYTKEIYYIGLAVDLGERYKQHNGIVAADNDNCKHKRINEYFSKNKKLGYTIFVQSPLAQARTHRNKSDHDDNALWISEESKEDIKVIEGSFIEAFRKRHGKFPKWNKVSGSTVGKRRVTSEMYDQMANCLTGYQHDFLVSKSSLREIAQDAQIGYFEIVLHGVRMSMLSRHISFGQAIDEQLAINPHFPKIYSQIVSSDYLAKQLYL